MTNVDQTVNQILNEATIDMTLSKEFYQDIDEKIATILKALGFNTTEEAYRKFFIPNMRDYAKKHAIGERMLWINLKWGDESIDYMVNNYTDKYIKHCEWEHANLSRDNLFIRLYHNFMGYGNRGWLEATLSLYGIRGRRGETDFNKWLTKHIDGFNKMIWKDFDHVVSYVLYQHPEIKKDMKVSKASFWQGEMTSDGGVIFNHGTYKGKEATAWVHAYIGGRDWGWDAGIYGGHLGEDEIVGSKAKSLWSKSYNTGEFEEEDEEDTYEEEGEIFQLDVDDGDQAWELVGGPKSFKTQTSGKSESVEQAVNILLGE